MIINGLIQYYSMLPLYTDFLWEKSNGSFPYLLFTYRLLSPEYHSHVNWWRKDPDKKVKNSIYEKERKKKIYLAFTEIGVHPRRRVPTLWQKYYRVLQVLKCTQGLEPMVQKIGLDVYIHRILNFLWYLNSASIYCH